MGMDCWVLVCCFSSLDHPGRLKSPATTTKEFLMLDAVSRLLASWSMHSSLEVLGW